MRVAIDCGSGLIDIAMSRLLRAILVAVLLFTSALPFQAAGQTPLPLHLQPPSRDASIEATLRWILCPRNDLRPYHSLLEGYLELLPADQFPKAFEALSRLQLRQKGIERTLLIAAWAKKDPEALWPVIKTWFTQAVDADHFRDDWAQSISRPAARTPLKTGTIVPDSRDFEAFEKGLSQSNASAKTKTALLNEFQEAAKKVFPHWTWPAEGAQAAPSAPAPPGEPVPPPPEIEYAFVRQLIEAPVEALPTLLDTAVKRRNEAAVISGLRRWVMLNPKNTPAVIAWTHQHSKNHLGKVLDAWAAIMPDEAYAWLSSLTGDERLDNAGVILPYVTQEQRATILNWVITRPGREADFDEMLPYVLQPWAVSDPKAAFEFALRHGGRWAYSKCSFLAFDQVARLAEFRQPIIEAIKAFPVQVHDEVSYMNMEEWGDIDFVKAAQYGVHWLIKEAATNPEAAFPMPHVIDVWTGRTNPSDGSMDDRTYGCLRLWAVIDPEGMKAWIQTLQDPAVRTALEWLRTHAEGGFEAFEKFEKK